jgi:hypothetical protein
MDQLVEQQIEQLRERVDRLEVKTDGWFTTPQVARRYGVTSDTIKRWRRDPRTKFPQGEIGPGGRVHTLESELRQYDLERLK